MALVELPGFIGSTYQTQSPFVDAERAINLIPEAAPNAGTRSKLWYNARPGLRSVLTLATTAPAIRGLYTTASFITYATQNNALYRLINSAGLISSTLLGTLDNPIAGLSSNYDRLCITSSQSQLLVANSSGYIWDGTTLTKITSAGFQGGTCFTQIKGYFIGLNNNQVFSSDLLNGLSWNALNFSLINSPDPPVAICTDQRELLWVFCQRHVQVFAFNSSLTAFPFSTVDGATMAIGLLARLSLVAADNTLFWFGADTNGIGGIYRANGFSPNKVSTPAVDAAILRNDIKINGVSQLSLSEAYNYKEAGHDFYVITIGTETWAYDITTDMWCERSHWNTATGLEDAHIARTHTFNADWGTHLCGDYRNGNVYEQSISIYSDPDTFVRRRRLAPVLWTGGNRNFFARLELGVEVGQLLKNAAGVIIAPTVSLRYSDDGSNTFGSPRVASCGKVGQFKTRAIWRQLGSAFQRSIEVVQTDAVRTAWTGAWVDMSQAPVKLGGR